MYSTSSQRPYRRWQGRAVFDREGVTGAHSINRWCVQWMTRIYNVYRGCVQGQTGDAQGMTRDAQGMTRENTGVWQGIQRLNFHTNRSFQSQQCLFSINYRLYQQDNVDIVVKQYYRWIQKHVTCNQDWVISETNHNLITIWIKCSKSLLIKITYIQWLYKHTSVWHRSCLLPCG